MACKQKLFYMILQKDVNGEVIGHYKTMREAARVLDITHSAISKSIKNKRSVYGKWLFEQEEDENEYEATAIPPFKTTTVKLGPIPEQTSITTPNDYTTSMPSAWDAERNKFLSIEEFCKKYGLPFESVKSSKLVSHQSAHMTYNIVFYTPEEKMVNNIAEDMEAVIDKYLEQKPTPRVTTKIDQDRWFDRLVYSDVHIAMDVNGYGDPLYDAEWDRNKLLFRLNDMITHVIAFQSSNTLYIDDLGDFLDGLNGKTARSEHDLPQNMNSKEAFDLALEFKVSLLDNLAQYYNRIICNNITDDNHASVFGYFVAQAFKRIGEAKYGERVSINTCKRFINHYSEGQHTFLLCHGKDSKNLKFGFKPFLDPKQAEKIDQYCKEHKLYNGNYIEFSKGDSHQAIFDDTTSNDFDYYSYPSFSPPSNWVKTNFKNTKSGFRFYNIDRGSQIKIPIPYYFED